MRRPSERDFPNYKIGEAIEKYIVRNRPNWSGGTERTYRKSLDTFENFAEEAEIEALCDVRKWTVGSFTDFLLARDYADNTILSKQKGARTWIRWLEGQGFVPIGTHLAIELIQIDGEDQVSSQILEPDEIESYLAYYREAPQWRATRRHALLEVIGHGGPRRIDIRALDVGDWDSESQTLAFRNRPETDTRLKEGDKHERKIVLAPEPAQILDEYLAQHRIRKHDEHGRSPLFSSRQGRPTTSTITNWVYQATLPCVKQQCPHSREPHKCQWANKQTKASQCPSSSSPHPMRRGSITWQMNLGRDVEHVAERTGTTPDVLRQFYDRPDLDASLRRRITDFEEIDITEHSDPTDIDDEINDEEDQ